MVQRTGQIYSELLRLGPLSNQELSNHFQLSPASITQILRPLIDDGLLEERDPQDYPEQILRADAKRGVRRRRKITFFPRREFGYLLAGEFIGTKLIFRKTDFALNLEEGFFMEISLDTTGDFLDQISRTIRDIQRKDDRRLLGVGFTVSGRVDLQTHRLVFSNNQPFLLKVDIAGEIKKRLGLATVVVNDSYAISTAERFCGQAKHLDHFLSLFIEEGVGLGIFVNGASYQGYQNLAGEPGNLIMVPGGRVHKGTPKGSVEAYISRKVLFNQLKEVKSIKVNHRCTEDIPFEPEFAFQLLTCLLKHNPGQATEILLDVADKTALLCANLLTLLAPEALFISGPLADLGLPLINGVKKSLEDYTPPDLHEFYSRRIRVSGNYKQNMAIGTAKVAADQTLLLIDEETEQ
jgi:predicted NBD/HSP70 family sugar kinase